MARSGSFLTAVTVLLLSSSFAFASIDGNWSGNPHYTNTNAESLDCSDFSMSVTVTEKLLTIHQSADCGYEWDMSVAMDIKDGALFQGDQQVGNICEDHIEFSDLSVQAEEPFLYAAMINLAKDRTVSFSDNASWSNGYSEQVNGALTSASFAKTRSQSLKKRSH